MSRADDIFISMCRSIIENGYSTEGEKYLVMEAWAKLSISFIMFTEETTMG